MTCAPVVFRPRYCTESTEEEEVLEVDAELTLSRAEDDVVVRSVTSNPIVILI